MDNLENKTSADRITVESMLKTTVQTLALLSLRQQTQLQQLTAPGPSLPELLATVMQQLPLAMPLIQAIRDSRKVDAIGPAERLARAQANVRSAQLARDLDELIDKARASDESRGARATDGAPRGPAC